MHYAQREVYNHERESWENDIAQEEIRAVYITLEERLAFKAIARMVRIPGVKAVKPITQAHLVDILDTIEHPEEEAEEIGKYEAAA